MSLSHRQLFHSKNVCPLLVRKRRGHIFLGMKQVRVHSLSGEIKLERGKITPA
jgi:hypothetical protein